MDEQVAVFLYSIRRNSSFTLSLCLATTLQRRRSAFSQPFSCRNALSGCHYHFCVLKNEQTLFLMMKAVR
ncbi:hypothetical protein EN871_17660 [bacterium M00.F.Ca.ET.228.01.1.1]|uniref:hypothetical protein n=1 Tax=Paraburkholderia phenoliruptrix TaxID=252970 RepID=UPI001092ACB7|nr:hypothetical protein [Paraburkholderia phenoliruptrix]MBW9130699.1 hypothetical protein [Paraburkholderia ginsengiterrae]TGP42761.1 hypothetical protein EN871_17660 [bacterium M00.F.Ca.ET.228.01.1.1]TGR98952.1 hypothetical protein EN834_20300 [bacterium M00.F.Ca.ET.191.01.1.1]TGU03266.1 hypothetical protein EN798_21120 [bacterium M00.F.Ca.ET.155.01.1.1]MBW0447327.1 hypothetical protein [Paraburkholderia phenoliruptrix]